MAFFYTLSSITIAECLKDLDDSGLSKRTIKNHYRTLVTAINWGADRKYVARDCVDGIKPPMIEHVTRDVYQYDELSLFIETAKAYKHYLPLKILL